MRYLAGSWRLAYCALSRIILSLEVEGFRRAATKRTRHWQRGRRFDLTGIGGSGVTALASSHKTPNIATAPSPLIDEAHLEDRLTALEAARAWSPPCCISS